MPPGIQEISSQNIVINQSYSLTVMITNSPTTVTVEGLLEGFVYSYNTSTGVLTISGTPTMLRASEETWTITAKNSVDTTVSSILYRVVELAPVIASVGQQSFRQGNTVNISTNISNKPSNVTVKGYLIGLNHAKTDAGVTITGRVDRDANFTISAGELAIMATNTGGSDLFNIPFGLLTSPVLANLPDQLLYVGLNYSFDISDFAFGFPVPTFTATSLPAGLSISSAGVITGTPTNDTDRTATIRVSNNQGSDTQTMVFVIEPDPIPPVLTNIPAQSLNVGTSFSYTVRATGLPTPTFSATGLPTDISINETTGVISGTPSTEQTVTVTITATNHNPITETTHTDTQNVVFTVSPRLTIPIIASITDKTFIADTPIMSFTATATGYPAPTFTATGLPSGLSIHSTTGVISGTAARVSEGSNSVTVRATNSNGNDTETFNIRINTLPIIPIISTQEVVVGVAYSQTFNIDGTIPITIAQSGFPSGIVSSINNNTLTLSGTPISTGVVTGSLTATNAAGADTQSVVFNVESIPTLNNIPAQSLTASIVFSYTVTSTAVPQATYSATGLPTDISINAITGVISGRPIRADQGANSVVVTATNDNGSDSQTVIFTVNAVPIIPNIPLQGLAVGSPHSAVFTINSTPVSTITVTGLPAGITFSVSGNTLTFGGTPTTIEMPTVTITAINAVGMDTHNVVFNVGAEFTVPILTAIPAQTLTAGTPFTHTVTSTANPTASYSATGLPQGLSINSQTGDITGTPTRTNQGTNSVIITATNHQGSDTETVVFTVNAIPIISDLANRTFVAGTAITAFTPSVNGHPSSTFTATGLPDGLSISTSTGRVSGTPTRTGVGTNNIVITATNIIGSDTEALSITINTIPVMTAIPDMTFVAGTAITPYTPVVDGHPDSTFTASGLPSGVSINASTGRLTGTPTRTDQGTNNITITATNDAGNHSQSATFTVNAIPVISAITDRTFVAGTAITAFTPNVNGHPDSTFTASGLPAGVAINASTGQITGTPTRTNYGVNSVTVTATNVVGSDTETFNITINTIPILTTSNIAFVAETAIATLTPTVSSDTYPTALTYSATGLPDDLIIKTTTGEITGIPTRDSEGTNNITITATNTGGSTTSSFVITINTIPVIPALDAQTALTVSPYSFDILIDGTSPITTNVTGLPNGLSASFDSTTNTLTISGTALIASQGDNSVTITATNAHGTDTETVNYFVTNEINIFVMNESRLLIQCDTMIENMTEYTIDHSITLNASIPGTDDFLYRGAVIDNDDVYYVNAANNQVSVGTLTTANNGTSAIARSLSPFPTSMTASTTADLDIEGNDLYMMFNSSPRRTVVIVNKNTGTETRRFSSQIGLGEIVGMAIEGDHIYVLTASAIHRVSKNIANNTNGNFAEIHGIPSPITNPGGLGAYDNRLYVSDNNAAFFGGGFYLSTVISFPAGLTALPSDTQVNRFGIPRPYSNSRDIAFDRSI